MTPTTDGQQALHGAELPWVLMEAITSVRAPLWPCRPAGFFSIREGPVVFASPGLPGRQTATVMTTAAASRSI
jgi:hypothetical protein